MDGPKGGAIPRTRTATHHEIFYVVRGGVTVFLDDADGERQVRELRPATSGYVPAGTVHAYRVEDDGTRRARRELAGFERFFQPPASPPTPPPPGLPPVLPAAAG